MNWEERIASIPKNWHAQEHESQVSHDHSVPPALMANYVSRSVSADPINQDPHGFYPTPRVATLGLLGVEQFEGAIWEPACGDGAISRELEARGHVVTSTDLYDRGYGQHPIDFLVGDHPRVDNVITNPPFKLMEEFVHRALSLTNRKVAILGRLSWLEGSRRYQTVFRGATPLARVWVFSSRLHFHRSGDASKAGSGGMVAFAWYIFDHGYDGPVVLNWLPPQTRAKSSLTHERAF